MRVNVKPFLLMALVLMATLVSPQIAAACYFSCVWDESGCGQCKAMGFFTGGDCEEPAPCVCNFVQACCGGWCSNPAPVVQKSTPSFMPAADNQCPAVPSTTPGDSARPSL
jgi:hypothetical protein